MTILFFARRFYPYIGGVEKHVLEISKRLIKQGHKIIVITEKVTSSQKHEIVKPLGLEIYRLNTGTENRSKKFAIWRELWKLRKVIQTADIIHCHDVFFWYLPFRFLYPNKKVFTTFHGYESYPIKKKAILIRKISERLSYGNICIGDFIKKWYKTHPTYVSYGAVDVVETKKPQKIQKPSAVFIGRLDDQTGILEYVKAVELLKKKYPKFELLVVGDGRYKSVIDKKVKTIGFQQKPESYFQNYRFAFVSRYLSILEAFAAKRLVIAVYDNPVKEDYLRMAPYTKFMIIVQKPEELANKIETIIKNPTREKKMIEGGYAFAKKQTWEKMTNIYYKLWTKGAQKKLPLILLSSLLFLSCLVYGINFPYVGPNATTANGFSLIAHNFNHYGYFQTKLAPVTSIAPQLPTDPNYYFHHPVLLSFTESLFFRVFGEDFWVGRLSVIVFTFGSFILIYFIGKQIANKNYATIALLMASLIPAFSIFGKLIDHEPLVLFYCLVSLFALLKYFHENQKRYLLVTFVATALAIMSDWPAIYFLPSFLILFIKNKKLTLLSVIIAFSISVIALILTNIYITKPQDFFGLLEPVQHSSLQNLLAIPAWPLRFISTNVSRFLVYFNPLLFIFSIITVFTIIKKIKNEKLNDTDLVIGGFGVFGFFHLMLYAYASFTHPYLVYYLVPFVIYGSALFIQKYVNKKSYIFLAVVLVFSVLYLFTIQFYKNKQILNDLWRYQLVVTINKYFTPYEEVLVNGMTALNADTFWRYSVILKQNDKVLTLDTKKYKHYVHSCPQVCKPDDIQLKLLKERYPYKHYINSGGEAYVFFLQQKQNASSYSFNTTENIDKSNGKENSLYITIRDMYRKVRDILHVPQL